MGERGKLWTIRQFKKREESRNPQLDSTNRFKVLASRIMQDDMPNLEGTKGKKQGREQRGKGKTVEIRKVKRPGPLREMTVKIGLERIDMQKGITVEVLLDSRAIGLVMSSEFAKKKESKLKKIENLIYVRNMDRTFNKEGSIENTVEVNIYYQGHKERTEIDVIGGQKWSVILGMPWLAQHNPKIDWKIGEVKITRCLEECGKQ